jgi:hypothetical protein
LITLSEDECGGVNPVGLNDAPLYRWGILYRLLADTGKTLETQRIFNRF